MFTYSTAGDSLSIQEPDALTDVELAQFSDADPSAQAGDFSATINWGDGSNPEDGTLTDNGDGAFAVTGGHEYDHAGAYSITVQIDGQAGQAFAVGVDADVSDYAYTVEGQDLAGQVGAPLGMVQTATFTDPYGQALPV